MRKKTGRPRGRVPGVQIGPLGTPRDPALVKKIIRLRDDKDWSWRELAAEVGLSHMAVKDVYVRWRNRPWYLNQS